MSTPLSFGEAQGSRTGARPAFISAGGALYESLSWELVCNLCQKLSSLRVICGAWSCSSLLQAGRHAVRLSLSPASLIPLESVVNLAVFVKKWPKIQHFS